MATILETFNGAPVISYSGWTRTVNNAHSGSFKYSSATVAAGATSIANITIPDGALTVQFWYYLEFGSPSSQLQYQVVSGGSGGSFSSPTSTWKRTSVISVEGKTTLRLTARASSFEAAATVHIDDVEFTLPDPVEPGVVLGWGRIPIIGSA